MVERLYRVEELHGNDLSFPVDLRRAKDQVTARMGRMTTRDPLRVVAVDYRLDPEAPPEPHTPACRRSWRGTVVRFPDVGHVGVAVCKPSSQHRFGNAVDWTAPPGLNDARLIDWLWGLFDFCRKQGQAYANDHDDGLPYSELIFRDKIATAARGWVIRSHGGQFHATHVHGSMSPLIDTSRPCA